MAITAKLLIGASVVISTGIGGTCLAKSDIFKPNKPSKDKVVAPSAEQTPNKKVVTGNSSPTEPRKEGN